MKIHSGNAQQPSVEQVGKQERTAQAKEARAARLKELCQEFEEVFVHTMLKGMRATVPDDGLFEKGLDKEMMEEMQDLEISKAVSRHSSIGIADALYRQLSRLEEQNAEKSDD